MTTAVCGEQNVNQKKRKCSTVSRNAPHCHTASMTFWYRTSADVRYRFERPNFTNILWKCENAMILVFDFIDPITVYFCTLSLSSSLRLLLFLFFSFPCSVELLSHCLAPNRLNISLFDLSLHCIDCCTDDDKKKITRKHFISMNANISSIAFCDFIHIPISAMAFRWNRFLPKHSICISEKKDENKTEQMKWNLFLLFAKFGAFFFLFDCHGNTIVNMNNK